MATEFYNNFKKELGDGSIDLLTDTIKLALVTSSYTPDIDAHTHFDDITNEVTGTGYTAGGATLASKTWVADNTNDLARFDAADVSWPSSTITARRGILYKDTGTPSTSPLIVAIDFGGDQSTSGAEFLVQWDTNGIFTLAQA